MERRLVLDRHREVRGQVGHGADVDELPAQRADGQFGDELGRGSAAGDDEDVVRDVTRVGALTHLDAEVRCAAYELGRDGRRLGDAVLPACNGADDVIRAQAREARRVGDFDGNAERALQRGARLQPRPAIGGGREEQVTDRIEQRRAELVEKLRALLREPHLGLRRELLPEPPHGFPCRAGCDVLAFGEHDVVRAEQRQVVRNRRPYGTGAGDDDSSHASSSLCSSFVSVRSGRRTSGRSGTPRRATTSFAAACSGKRSSATRTGPRSALDGSRTAAATSSGNADASADTAPTAPAARPRVISDSGPTKMSSPSSRYGAKRSHGVSETLSPRKFGAASRRFARTSTGTAYPLRAANSYT